MTINGVLLLRTCCFWYFVTSKIPASSPRRRASFNACQCLLQLYQACKSDVDFMPAIPWHLYILQKWIADSTRYGSMARKTRAYFTTDKLHFVDWIWHGCCCSISYCIGSITGNPFPRNRLYGIYSVVRFPLRPGSRGPRRTSIYPSGNPLPSNPPHISASK